MRRAVLHQVTVAPPQPGEVRVKVVANALCHTDVHAALRSNVRPSDSKCGCLHPARAGPATGRSRLACRCTRGRAPTLRASSPPSWATRQGWSSSLSARASRRWPSATTWCLLPCHAVPMLCCAMLCYAMLWYAMVCYGMLCYATLRYATWCRAIAPGCTPPGWACPTPCMPRAASRACPTRRGIETPVMPAPCIAQVPCYTPQCTAPECIFCRSPKTNLCPTIRGTQGKGVRPARLERAMSWSRLRCLLLVRPASRRTMSSHRASLRR